jgi:N-methylhydantoinase A/oxoprolinase/acetone carboxylase beta subunit
MGARISFARHYNKMMGKAKVKRLEFRKVFLFSALMFLFLFPVGAARGQETSETPQKDEAPAAQSELDKLKMEWEAVREQQVQMIREKEDQLEKLKEEIFSKMKSQGGLDVSGGSAEFEAQKAAFQVERQKLFAEISRQKESLRQFQLSLDERAKLLELERDRFEQEKKTVPR